MIGKTKDMPWGKFYYSNFMIITQHLSNEDVGRLMRAKCLAWQGNGSFPHDDEWVAHKLNVSPDEVNHLYRPLFQEFFKKKKKRWVDLEIVEHLNAVKEVSQSRSGNAKLRWSKANDSSKSNADAIRKKDENINTEKMIKNVAAALSFPRKNEGSCRVASRQDVPKKLWNLEDWQEYVRDAEGMLRQAVESNGLLDKEGWAKTLKERQQEMEMFLQNRARQATQ